jgi:hypothetical protein
MSGASVRVGYAGRCSEMRLNANHRNTHNAYFASHTLAAALHGVTGQERLAAMFQEAGLTHK